MDNIISVKSKVFDITTRMLKICDDKQVKAAYLYKNKVAPQQTVYEVFNGRQKPGMDFTLRFIELFPDIDIQWLMTGEGEKYKTQNLGLSGVNIVKGNKKTKTKTTSGSGENSMAEEHYKEMLEEKDKRIADLQVQNKALLEQNKTLISVIDILKGK